MPVGPPWTRATNASSSTMRAPKSPAPSSSIRRERLLYLIEFGGKALRYGIGVGRPGFTWAGVKTSR